MDLTVSFELRGGQIHLDGRKIGYKTKLANGELTFVSPRKRSTHYFRIFKGWGISKEVLQYLKDEGFTRIHLRTSKIETLMSTLDAWFRHGIPYQREPYEPQVILPEIYFQKKLLTISDIS